jgi:hypothetical protein
MFIVHPGIIFSENANRTGTNLLREASGNACTSYRRNEALFTSAIPNKTKPMMLDA